MTIPFTATTLATAEVLTRKSPLGHQRVLLTAAETGGSLGSWEETVAPGCATPWHVHHREDEMLHVLTGRVRVFCGSRSFTAEPGAAVMLPRGEAHRVENAGDAEVRLLATVTPGGFEGFFAEFAGLKDHSPAAVMALAARYGLAFGQRSWGRAA